MFCCVLLVFCCLRSSVGPLHLTLNSSTLQHWKSDVNISLGNLIDESKLVQLQENFTVVAVHPLFDKVTLARLGAWPPPRDFQHNSTWTKYANRTADAIESALMVRPDLEWYWFA